MKTTVPVIIAAVAGLVLAFSFFIPAAESWGETVTIWFDILAGFAFVIGGGNILKNCLKKISDRKPGWGYAGVTMVAFLATLFVGLFKIGVNPSENYPTHVWAGDYLANGGALWWAYQYIYYPLAATMFALLAFYIASASFRAFRAKNTEAIILLGTAFIVLLGQSNFGNYLTNWAHPELQLGSVTAKIMSIFNLAGSRAIMIGIALGTVSLSIRIILGVDRSYLGSE